MVLKSDLVNIAKRSEALDREVRSVCVMCLPNEAPQSVSPNIARLTAGLTGDPSLRHGATKERNLFFFLGSSVTLIFTCIILLLLPPDDVDTFDTPYFLAPFPLFQAVLSVLLTLWNLGLVMHVCDKMHINYLFILGVDPRCAVTPGFFFSRAAGLTTCWFVMFCMYILDYKWMVLPRLGSGGFNQRTSWHYTLYPAVVVLVTFIVIAWPSLQCGYKYKMGIFKSLLRTCLAPLYFVSFADNLLGDIVTSLVKPLTQIPQAWCFLVSHHPQTRAAVERFELYGNTCPDWEHHYFSPVISVLPYFWRSMQCLRRFRDTRQRRHLVNFGKYFVSMLVVVVSSAFTSNIPAVLIVSSCATIYSATWDIRMDWGLSMSALKKKERPAQLDSEVVQPTSFQQGGVQRHFSPSSYIIASLLDIIARSTWTHTLMPGNALTNNIQDRIIISTASASIEIFRRAMWAAIRIENEQVSNAGGFRTLLWVPDKLNSAASVQRKTVLAAANEDMANQMTSNMVKTSKKPLMEEIS